MITPLRGLALVLPVFASVGIATPLAAQMPCDPALKQVLNSPIGYRLRGDRCEGIYIKDVGATILRVAGFTESFDPIDYQSRRPLTIDWPRTGVASGSVRVRVESLRRRTYYRMDTLRPAGSTSFSWPIDILAAERLERQDIGVTALVRTNVDGVDRDLLIPASVRQQAGKRSRSYTLVVLPGVELEEVYLTLGRLARGAPETYLKNGLPLRFGYYPAERPVVIPLGELPGSGVYHVQVGARLRDGGGGTIDAWLLQEG